MKLYKAMPIKGHFAEEVNASLARLKSEYKEVFVTSPYSAFVPAPEAEAKIAPFIDWLARQMPIRAVTINVIRAYGLTTFANWCEEFNKRFAEIKRGQ